MTPQRTLSNLSLLFRVIQIKAYAMAPMVVAIAKVALVVVMLAAMATGMWMNSRMFRRAREAGYRYWAINPMSVLSGLRGIEPLIFILALLVAMASIMGLFALN
jgi:hypothetical protein